MRVILCLLVSTMVLSACGKNYGDRRVRFDGEVFRGNAKALDRADRRGFVATAGPVSRSLKGAREAVRYEGTKYCIRWFGVSDIDWVVDPLAEGATLPIDNDKIILRGTCVE